MRLKLVISYDGTDFAGWQSQPGRGAIQDHLEAALQRIAGQRVVVHASGRTDAGVHALAQCAHVDVPDKGMTPQAWLRAINGNIPYTVRVLSATQVPQSFHARFSAKGKTYQYQIHRCEVLPPLELNRAWQVHFPLDIDRLHQAAQIFVGKHDFAAFAANRGEPTNNTLRRIHEIRVNVRGERISLSFTGEGFLYKMVRMLTGAIVRCAAGHESLDDLRQRLEQGSPKWSHVAPACGLYLVKVYYRAPRSAYSSPASS